MASQVILKKSSVAARVPVVGDLAYGELALNYADGLLYFKKSDGTTIGIIGNATGTNTGDETTATIKTKLGITTLSGSNTGDNAYNSTYAGLVSNATHTGDVTGFTALTLATVNSNVGTWNTVTVNGKGLVTAGSNTAYLTAVTATAPVASSGGTTPVISMAAATASVSGYLTSTDWNTFNGKQAAGTYATGTGSASGANTGDETTATIKTKLGITTLSGSNTGDQTIPTTLPNANAITFNSSGGAAAGSTYTGAAVLTVDYATVGAAAAGHTHSYQAADADLLAIGGLTGTTGLLKKTAADTWTLDTTAYYHSGNVPPYPAEADTLATVTGRGASTTTAITVGNTSGTSISITTASASGTTAAPKNLSLLFLGYNNKEMAKISSWDESGSTGNGNLLFWTGGGGAALATERMRIDTSGNVGIGTTTPDVFANGFERNFGVVTTSGTAVINVSGSAASRIQFGVSGTRYGLIYQDATNFMQLGTTTALPISFTTNATERMRLDASGKVGIGTASPLAPLHVFYAPAANTTVDDVVRITSKYNAATGASAAAGSGPAIVFSGGIGDNQTRDRARIVAVYEASNMSGLSFHTQSTADIVTERMRLTINGGVSFGSTGTAYGTSGQVLQSNGNASPTWVNHVTSIAATTPIVTSAATGAITLSHATSGVTAGTYNNVTVNVTGHVTAGSNVAYYHSGNVPPYPAEADTLATVTGRGASTTTAVILNGGLSTGTASTGVTRGMLTTEGNFLSYYAAETTARIQLGRDVGGSGSAGLALGGSTYALIAASDTSGTALYFKLSAAAATAATSPNMSLTATGLGVGIAAPAAKLHVYNRADAGAAPSTPEIRIEHQDINAVGTGGSHGGLLSFYNIQQNNTGWAADAVWGKINFWSSQPSSGVAELKASIWASSDGAIGGTTKNTYIAFATSAGTAVPAERLRVTSNGGIAFGGAANYGSSGQVLQSNGDAAPTWVAHVTSIAATTPILTSAATGAITLSHATSGVTAGTYNNVTVNATGHVTAGSNTAYLTALSDTLATVTGRGATTSTASTFSGGLSTTTLGITGDMFIRNSGPTIHFVDSNERGAAIHNNSNLLYILSSNGIAGESWTQNSGEWPFYINVDTNAARFGGVVVAAGAISASNLSGTNTGDNPGVTSVAGVTPIVSSGGNTPSISHATSGVSAGTYNNVTVNATGHVTAGSNAAYLTAEADTLATVTARGNIATSHLIIPAGEGNALGFWNGSTTYSLAMGSSSAYQYGTVTDYSLKMNMGAGAGRGFTWGQNGVTPIASLNSTSGNMQIAGTFSALSKSFLIDHPTKPGMQLRHGSLEGPENGVYIRGRLKGNKIELPEYWTKLVDPDSITVNLTAIGKSQDIYVEDIIDNVVYVGGENVNCFYTVYAERVDVAKLEVEIG